MWDVGWQDVRETSSKFRVEVTHEEVSIGILTLSRFLQRTQHIFCSINWQARHDLQQSEPRVTKETNPSQIIRDAAEIRQNEEVLKVIIFVEAWSNTAKNKILLLS